jgi:hypothetical protein
LRSRRDTRCSKERPCINPCVKCQAETWLTTDDWVVVGFFQRVSDQYINQAPMGTEKGKPPVVTPRLEAYEVALRAHRYPRELWGWLMDATRTLHNLFHGIRSSHGANIQAVTRLLTQHHPWQPRCNTAPTEVAVNSRLRWVQYIFNWNEVTEHFRNLSHFT